MPYRNKQMLRDANGDLIPQYWDVAAGDFKPLTGSDGANDTRLTGSIVEEVKIIERDVYNENISTGISIPAGVRGALFNLRVHAVTGELNDGEGVKFYVRIGGLTFYTTVLASDIITANATVALIFGSTSDIGDADNAYRGSQNKTTGISLLGFKYARYYMDITGVNVSVDAESIVSWIY